MLTVAAFSASLISTARYPSPASWNLSLYLICLLAVFRWFKVSRPGYLILSLSLGLISVQIHGAQIALLAMTLLLVLKDLVSRLAKKQTVGFLIFIWLIITGLIFASQLA
jgi:hypothetical protein